MYITLLFYCFEETYTYEHRNVSEKQLHKQNRQRCTNSGLSWHLTSLMAYNVQCSDWIKREKLRKWWRRCILFQALELFLSCSISRVNWVYLWILHIYGVKTSVNNQNEAFYSVMVFFFSTCMAVKCLFFTLGILRWTLGISKWHYQRVSTDQIVCYHELFIHQIWITKHTTEPLY